MVAYVGFFSRVSLVICRVRVVGYSAGFIRTDRWGIGCWHRRSFSGLLILEAWNRPALLLVAAGPWLIAWVIADQNWVSPTKQFSVALVQGNVAQETKWLPESAQPIFDRYERLSDNAWEKDLVIWPEAAITVPYSRA
ncbi:MAG: hypothetical protein Ct9H300mP8_00150 [Gammaproteobacteria bacterium]|nr:MAG: hypothetical protein Ct9H300mP8_00150 [Gammaproteobacteria bacterium]